MARVGSTGLLGVLHGILLEASICTNLKEPVTQAEGGFLFNFSRRWDGLPRLSTAGMIFTRICPWIFPATLLPADVATVGS